MTSDSSDKNLKKKISNQFIRLGVRTVIIAACLYLMFGVVYSFHHADGTMAPSMKTGDMTMSFCLDRSFKSGDVVTYNDGESTSQYRIVAVAGDTVDFKNGALVINDYPQAESYLYGQETTAWQNEQTFPMTVGEGQVFLLKDQRANKDSRIFGCVNAKDIKGKVVAVLRRFGI